MDITKSKIKLKYMHFCDFASFSQDDKINMIGVFKNIVTAQIPAIQLQMFIVLSLTEYDVQNIKIRIEIVSSSGKVVASSSLDTIAPAKPKSQYKKDLTIISQINNMELDEFGEYKVNLYFNDDLLDQKILNVISIQDDQGK